MATHHQGDFALQFPHLEDKNASCEVYEVSLIILFHYSNSFQSVLSKINTAERYGA